MSAARKPVPVRFTPEEVNELHFFLMSVYDKAADQTGALASAYDKISEAKHREGRRA